MLSGKKKMSVGKNMNLSLGHNLCDTVRDRDEMEHKKPADQKPGSRTIGAYVYINMFGIT